MEDRKILREDVRILATDARTIADTTRSVANHLYKAIREEAKEGRTEIHWCVFSVSNVTLQNLINELKDFGYSVDTITSDQESNSIEELLVKW